MLARSLLFPALCLFATQLLADTAPSANDQARFLAGLPVADSPLAAVAGSKAWTDHAASFTDAWKKLEDRQLTPIATWSETALKEVREERGPLFYMFSGPDFLYAHAFAPNASTYVLCGIEPVGTPPEVEKVAKEALAPSLQTLRQALDSVLSFSFFITKKMKVDLTQTKLSGTLPVIYVFLARSGCHIDDVRLVGLDDAGTLVEGKAATPGVKITFTGPNAERGAQTLYYFCSDLSDGPASKSGFLKWCNSLGEGRSFLKAASYLMHGSNFTTVRSFLLNRSKSIVQDESGVPIKSYEPSQWSLQPFGAYTGPITLFKDYNQPQLTELYRKAKAPAIPFSFGYRWHPSESTLIFATKAGAAPAPAPATAPAPGPSSVPQQ